MQGGRSTGTHGGSFNVTDARIEPSVGRSTTKLLMAKMSTVSIISACVML